MRVLRFIGLGIFIWGLTLLWPQVNQLLTPPMVIGVTLGMGAVALAYLLIKRLNHSQSDHITSQDHPSRPIPVTATR